MGYVIQKLVAEAQGHANARRWEAAAGCLIQATQRQPNDPGLWLSLGEVYRMANAIAAARQAYETALKIAPRFAHAHLLMATVLDLQGETGQALHYALNALDIEPRYESAAITATNLLLKTGNVDGSVQMGRRAVELAPGVAIAWLNLGNALLRRPETLNEAEAAYRQAVTLAPDFSPAHNSFGTALNLKEDFDAAIEHFHKASQLDPSFFGSWANLAQAFLTIGLIAESMQSARKALALAPQTIPVRKLFLFTLSYTDWGDRQILEEHRRFVDQLVRPAIPANDTNTALRTPGKTIRIGYLSPDFRDHPIAFFIEPLLAAHDRSRFDVFCYQMVAMPDAVTTRLQTYPATWRDISMMDDNEAARAIRSDQLDVAIDLAGHSRGGRIELFARRLAPVQVSYLGHPMTTGLAEMDYRLTDSIADPPGEDTSGYVEELVRMPKCFCCFSIPQSAPDVGPLPAERNGFVTFGSLQAMAKVNERVVELWAKVMLAVPGSRLLMARNALTAATQERLRGLFSAQGVGAERITFHQQVEPGGGHWKFYNQIDVSLDTIPFTGHTTACQSLFMGVPIVTLAGASHRQRLVATVLTHAGHPEWIAHTSEEYVEIVRRLAGDIGALAKLRGNLREELTASALCDARGFTKDFELTIEGLIRQKLEKRESCP